MRRNRVYSFYFINYKDFLKKIKYQKRSKVHPINSIIVYYL